MDLHNFVYQSQPSRVIFGAGSIQQLGQELELLGCKKALVLCTPGQIALAHQAAEILQDSVIGIYDRAVMHVPVETVREAQDLAKNLGADCTIAIGGGSTTGLAKAIALACDLPIIAIPTTYAGSEMTSVYGLTENHVKVTGKDPRVLPKTVIYDPDLSKCLALEISITSGINAMAHAAEGLYAKDGNPIMSLLATEGIRTLAQGLKKLVVNDRDIEARSACLYGAWLCGTVLGNVGMALHHKLCHTLGGTFNLPHAQTHTIILPHVIAFNEVARPEISEKITQALGAQGGSAGQALFDFIQELNAPTQLRALNFKEEDIVRAIDLACANRYWNPRAFTKQDLEKILQQAYWGERPE